MEHLDKISPRTKKIETEEVRNRIGMASKSLRDMLQEEEEFWQRQVRLKVGHCFI